MKLGLIGFQLFLVGCVSIPDDIRSAGIFETGLTLDHPTLAVCPVIVSHFGDDNHPFSDGKRSLGTLFRGVHPGADIVVPIGTPVYAMAAGIVSRTGFDDVGGNVLAVQHAPADTGLAEIVFTDYGHLRNFAVGLADRVLIGQLLGYSGDTPATRPHLHVQARYGTELFYFSGAVVRGKYVDIVSILSGDVSRIDSQDHDSRSNIRQPGQSVRFSYRTEAAMFHYRNNSRFVFPLPCVARIVGHLLFENVR